MIPAVPAKLAERGLRPPDADVLRLAELFRSHPAWLRAANRLDPGACSEVRFSHRPGEVWHLASRHGRTLLAPGSLPNPDLSLRFTPAAIAKLAAVEGGVGDFAVALFEAMLEADEEPGVAIRIVAPFATLARKGYVALLLAGGAKLLAFGAARGIRTLADLRRLVRQLQTRGPYAWERPTAGQAKSQR